MTHTHTLITGMTFLCLCMRRLIKAGWADLHPHTSLSIYLHPQQDGAFIVATSITSCRRTEKQETWLGC